MVSLDEIIKNKKHIADRQDVRGDQAEQQLITRDF